MSFMPTKTARVTVILNREQQVQLDTYRRATGQSRSGCLRSLLLAALKTGIPYQDVLAHEAARKATQSAKALAAQERELVREHRRSFVEKRKRAMNIATTKLQAGLHDLAEAEKARDQAARHYQADPDTEASYHAMQAVVADRLRACIEVLEKMQNPKLYASPNSPTRAKLGRLLLKHRTALKALTTSP